MSPIISDYFNAGSQSPAGAIVSAYLATRFGSPPAQNASPPGSADAGPVTVPTYGGPGAFEITVPTVDNYYVGITFSGNTYWKYYPAGSGTVVTASSGATSSLTPAPRSTSDMFSLITSATGTFTFNNPSGTPIDGQKLTLRFKSTAASMTYAFGTLYRASTGLSFPATSSNDHWDYIGLGYNGVDTKWDLLAVIQGF